MIAIHQSHFFPWVPYFYKIVKADRFVILDDVQYEKNGIQNRNMIKTPQGEHWFTLPVSVKMGEKINEVKVNDLANYDKLLKTLEANYKKAPYFTEVFESLKGVFEAKYEGLHAFNTEALQKVLALMNFEPKVDYSSSFETKEKKDDLVIEIIKHFGEKEYLSGRGALEYMDLNKFKDAGIDVYVMNFKYRPYKQLWEKQASFVPNLSILDLLFNDKDHVLDYIRECGDLEKVTG